MRDAERVEGVEQLLVGPSPYIAEDERVPQYIPGPRGAVGRARRDGRLDGRRGRGVEAGLLSYSVVFIDGTSDVAYAC